MNIKLHLVNNIEDLLEKGDALITKEDDGRKSLIIVCPGCGKISGDAMKHTYTEETQSYTPSIIYGKNHQEFIFKN